MKPGDVMTSKPQNKMEPRTLLPRRSTATQAAQARAKRGSAKGLLPIYLGQRTSERVLAGQAKRGTGEKIHAVVWLCDMRDSTLFSESMSIENFFALLRYELLKFVVNIHVQAGTAGSVSAAGKRM